MAASILVAYATKYGSTEGVANAVADELRGIDFDAELAPVGDVPTVDGFDAVVLGTPIYIGKLLKEARTFLARHRRALEEMPVAVFALGPTSRDDDFAEPQQQFDDCLADVPWLDPVEARLFCGALDPEALRFPDSLVKTLPASPLRGKPATDGRDWDAIRAWARELPLRLGLAAEA
jgi:menaquinone-dependent protoporphyrinogen oxidase